MDFRKKELIMSIEKLEARVITECKEEKQQNDALEIKKYVHLEKYDKTVMAALITKVEVLDEDTINVVWKYQSEYDKILAVLQKTKIWYNVNGYEQSFQKGQI